MLKDLREFEFSHYFLVMMGIGGLVSPGLLLILQFRPELLQSLDIFKLILMSFSLSVPTALIWACAALVEHLLDKSPRHPSDNALIWCVATFFNMAASTFGVASCYLQGLTFRGYCKIAIPIYLGIAIVSIVRLQWWGKRPESASREATSATAETSTAPPAA